MQDLSPQTKAKTTARISFRDFTDAFNAVGPILMMSIHILVINCLMHNPDVFAERSVRAPSTEKFKADPTFKNMMRYLIDQILMRRRTIKRSTNDWDCAAYLDEEEEEDTEQRRPSRSKRSLAHPHPKSGQSSNPAASTSRNVVCSITLSSSVLIKSNYYIDIDLIKI